MKRYVLLAVFVCFVVPTRSAASGYAAPIHDRVHGGFVGHLNLSSLASDDFPEEFSRNVTGYSFGGFLVMPQGPVVAGQLEWLITSKGGKMSVNVDGLQASDEFRFTYLESAYLLRLNFPLESGPQIYGEFGPIISILLSARWEGRISNGLESVSDSRDITDEIQSVEIGAALGAGVAIPLGDVGLLLGLRHHWGLTSVSSDVEAFSRNLQFRTGIYL